jgi:predicted DNA-binding ribbon-helix-helix protein
MIRTQIQLKEEQARKLKKIAAQRKVSMAELIRQGVDGILAEEAGADREERKERALAAAGRFASGLRDVSAEHDRHLAEAFEK